MTHDLRICDDIGDLGRRAAEAAAAIVTEAVRDKGRCSIALAGGNTPRPMYRALADTFGERIQWTQVHVFWGDERFLPAGDERRNESIVREAILDRVSCPPANVHAVSGLAASADEAAGEYERVLRQHFPTEWPRFDLVLLGLGADGHTASLFPRSSALGERQRWALAATVPADPPLRITLTLPVFNRAAVTFFLVSGSAKAHALHQVLSGADPAIYPAAGIHPAGSVVWWVDRDLAQALAKARRA